MNETELVVLFRTQHLHRVLIGIIERAIDYYDSIETLLGLQLALNEIELENSQFMNEDCRFYLLEDSIVGSKIELTNLTISQILLTSSEHVRQSGSLEDFKQIRNRLLIASKAYEALVVASRDLE